MSRTDICHPIAHRFVDRFFERGLSNGHPNYLRSQELHAHYVQSLSLHVRLAHVNDTLQTESSRHRGRGYAVLSRPGLGNEASLTHAYGKQGLSYRIVDFMRSR